MLLFDQNLSPRLVRLLSIEYPGSQHVMTLGLDAAPDPILWNFALQQGLMIVSKDADFQQRAMLYGHPPKVIWVRVGSCPTPLIAVRMKSLHNDILDFSNDANSPLFVVL